jgi:hypothetical protein
MEIEGQCKNSGLNLPKQNQISFQNHIELVYPFKLQSLVGMEDFSTMWSSWILIQSNHEVLSQLQSFTTTKGILICQVITLDFEWIH